MPSRIRLPEALAELRQYFLPLHLEAIMTSPSTVCLTLIDPRAERVTIDDIACGPTLDRSELFTLIGQIEARLRIAKPDMLDWLVTRQEAITGR